MLARLAELPLLVVLLAIAGVLALVPAVHGLAVLDFAVARDFFYSALVLLILSAMLGLATAAFSPRDPAQSQLASLVGAYLALPFAFLLPWGQALPDTTFVNAWFEMTSSFTTTGATVYEADRLSDTLHLWRAIVGWYGGFLILLAAYGILAPLSLGGFEVASGRVPGRRAVATTQAQRLAEPAQRLGRWALRLLPVYAGLTLALWIGLMMAGEGSTTALIQSMGTLSTSGISGQSDLSDRISGFPGEALIFVFFLFALSRRAFPVPGIGTAQGGLLADPELRLALQILGLVLILLFFRHWFIRGNADDIDSLHEALASLWGVLFTAASFLTTTGYVSADWQTAADWSGIGTPGMILLGLAILGGGIATAAGGVKLLRIYALLRHGKRELERIIHPSSVGGGGPDLRRLLQEGAQLAWVFFMLFAISIAIVVGVLTLLGVSFEPALVLAIAALTTTGQLADLGAGAPIVYSDLSGSVKLVLGLAMVLGRLETLALLAFLLPARGRR
ncbi:MAG: potassium transporter TrkH [Rhodobacterales bacterium 32-66-7]|nr:MAG: potassium transporter TrkH [Rhodobacterales bacterium 32-66-7]